MNTTLVTTSNKEPIEVLSVRVSQSLIDSSQPENVNKCMVAEAIHLKFPTATFIYVDAETIRFTLDGLRYRFRTPEKASDFIIRYDRHESVKPFTCKAKRIHVQASGFLATHPNGDNRTDPNKKYKKSEKKRRYAQRKRIHGICHYVSVQEEQPSCSCSCGQ